MPEDPDDPPEQATDVFYRYAWWYLTPIAIGCAVWMYILIQS